MRAALIIAAALLTGCAAGINQLSPEQLKQLDGLAACNYYHGMYGKAGTVVVSNDTVRKGATNKFKVSISPDSGCAVVIEGDIGVAPATPASGAR